jgi:hypothetical protein
MNSSIKLKINSKNFLFRLTNYRLEILIFGLILWLFFPIIGIFPILLYIQLNILVPNKNKRIKNKKSWINNILLLLVVLTVTIFISSLKPYADTLVYLRNYSELDQTGPFGVGYGRGLEFMTFLLAYPTYLLSNGSPYLFLFNHALFINLIITFIIAKNLSKQFYPLLLALVFSGYLYYTQVFYMRQFLANALLILAISFFEHKKFFFLIPWSIFAHLSNLPFSLATLIFKLDNYSFKITQKILNKKIIFSLAISAIIIHIAFSFYIYGLQAMIDLIQPILTLSNSFLGNNVVEYLQNLLLGYNEKLKDIEYSFPLISVVDTVIVGGLILIGAFKKTNKITSCLVIIYCMYLVAFIFVAITGFNWRICLLFFSLSGIFYAIGIESNNSKVQNTIIIIAFLKIIYFCLWLTRMNQYVSFVFFEGKPLEMTAYDYIVYFFNSLVTR